MSRARTAKEPAVPVADSPRLFVPLVSEAYRWFADGGKTWELRRYGRQYTEQHVYPGRRVELRRGYSTGDSLRGTIVDVVTTNTIGEFFRRVPFEVVVPTAESLEDAINAASRILGTTGSERFIGFRVAIDGAPSLPAFKLSPESAALHPVHLRGSFASAIVYSWSAGQPEIEVGTLLTTPEAGAGLRAKIDAALDDWDADGPVPDIHLMLTADEAMCLAVASENCATEDLAAAQQRVIAEWKERWMESPYSAVRSGFWQKGGQ